VFNNIKRSGFNCFEGKFYSKPVVKSQMGIVPIKVNRIQLLNIVRDEEFDISEVVKVVGQDPSLSVSLLKFVNSPYLGISQKIQTIQHAVAMLGQTEVRKWVTTATSGALADDKPDEVTKLSLMRAKFAENLAPRFEMAIHSPGLFLMGLFSVLDVILEMPMEEALKIVTVSDKIQQALVSLEGDFAKVLGLIYTYEQADWNELNRLMIVHKLDVEGVVDSYIEAAKWYTTIVADDGDEADGTAAADEKAAADGGERK
jgi:EAL and modified HD-GYP domain-containing signal transduction protein